ncbi:hypothetical protein WMY93_000133 [Mugilogobius chulae]|uniref:Uncharacterized protein n=1 Tax=Mugilogobius chulae TaxID=88201 RepID=A0AAW0Q896_9GOBI
MSPRRWLCPGLTIFLWICATELVHSQYVNHKNAQFDVMYPDSVTSSSQIIYAFSRTITSNTTEGVRLTVDVLSRDLDHPVQFVVRQKQDVLSFQVPMMLRGVAQNEYPFYHIGRTLCHPPIKSASETQTQSFFVDVSTLSGQRTNTSSGTDQKLNFSTSPSQPQYFKYVFPEG